MNINLDVNSHVRIRIVLIFVLLYLYISIYICTHAYIHTYIHTHTCECFLMYLYIISCNKLRYEQESLYYCTKSKAKSQKAAKKAKAVFSDLSRRCFVLPPPPFQNPRKQILVFGIGGVSICMRFRVEGFRVQALALLRHLRNGLNDASSKFLAPKERKPTRRPYPNRPAVRWEMQR